MRIPPSMEVWTLSPMEIDPASGISRPAIERNKVVLPHPDGPRNERIPFSNSKLTLSSAFRSL